MIVVEGMVRAVLAQIPSLYVCTSNDRVARVQQHADLMAMLVQLLGDLI